MFQRLKQLLFRPLQLPYPVASKALVTSQLFATGNVLTRLLPSKPTSIHDIEFRVFSQWGEDGIIQFILSKIQIDHELFVEFGVQNYEESNTRFLLVNNNWKGLVIDASTKNIQHIIDSEIYWQHDLTAINQFVTIKNINKIISSFSNNIGMLSIDIDGVDYWVWKAISIQPSIVICEYNSVFGNQFPVTVPYKPAFDRTNYHYSNLCFGASLPALKQLAKEKGYYLFCCNSAGNNAFFVRNEYRNVLPPINDYVESKYRESRDSSGKLNYIGGADRQKIIRDCQVVDLRNMKITSLGRLH